MQLFHKTGCNISTYEERGRYDTDWILFFRGEDVLGIELRALLMLGKHSNAELWPFLFFVLR